MYLQRGSSFTWLSPANQRPALGGTWDAIAQDIGRRLALTGGATSIQAATNGGGFFSVTGFGDNIYLQIKGITNSDFNDASDLKNLISGIAYKIGVGFDANAVQFGAQGPGAGGVQTGYMPGGVMPAVNSIGGSTFLDQLGISPTTAALGVLFVVFVVPMFVRKR
jgi:hypothetical protein